MGIEDTFTKEEVITAISKLEKDRKEYELDTTEFGHRVWSMLNYTGAYMQTYFKITEEDRKEYDLKYDI